MEKENLMNTKEVCEYLGVSRIWLKEKIRPVYGLKPVAQLQNTALVYDRAEIEELKERMKPATILREFYKY